MRLIDFRTGTRWTVVDHGNRSKKSEWVVTSFCSPLNPMAFVVTHVSCVMFWKMKGSLSIELAQMNTNDISGMSYQDIPVIFSYFKLEFS